MRGRTVARELRAEVTGDDEEDIRLRRGGSNGEDGGCGEDKKDREAVAQHFHGGRRAKHDCTQGEQVPPRDAG